MRGFIINAGADNNGAKMFRDRMRHQGCRCQDLTLGAAKVLLKHANRMNPIKVLYCTDEKSRNPIAAVKTLRKSCAHAEISVCAYDGHSAGRLALDCLHAGARDFFSAGMTANRLVHRIGAACSGEPAYGSLGLKLAPGSRVFISTPYAIGANEDVQGIEEAVRDAGLSPLISRKEPKLDDITSKISGEINGSELVIANCTVYDRSGHNPNIYHEVGFARGRKKQVMYVMRIGGQPLPVTLGAKVFFDYHASADLAVQIYFSLRPDA